MEKWCVYNANNTLVNDKYLKIERINPVKKSKEKKHLFCKSLLSNITVLNYIFL